GMMREYTRKGKPVFHASNLKNYFECPKKMKLSERYELPSTQPQKEGLLFEGYLLGFKQGSTEDDIRGIDPSDKRKGMKDATVAHIKSRANDIKNFLGKGEPYVKMEYETDSYILQGEADFIGTAFYGNEEIKLAIVDLKYTGDIERVWNGRIFKHQYLQAVVYPYLYLQNFGEVPPFIYFLVQDNPPFFKQIIVEPTFEDFEWLESNINNISSDLFFSANASRELCLGQFGNM